MNSFYNQPRFLQWICAILLVIIGFYPAILIIELSYIHPLYNLLFLLYVPIGQFCFAPLFTLTGMYTYYSPMLLGYGANKAEIDLHSGVSFDYLFVMRKFKAGMETRNNILIYQLEGLMNLAGQIKSGEIPASVMITGTSYFFSERTITKLGFEQKNPSLFYRINLLINFIDIAWMYSLSKGYFAMPKIWKAKKVSIEGGELLGNVENLQELHKRLIVKSKRKE